ncbi:MAG TPA: cytoplasmic protein [Mesorhizobium sp.]|nr:cytoplasmic protein [Mesorhizobium sp.]
MRHLETEARLFAEGKLEAVEHAGQLAAASLICGFDLETALKAVPEQKARFIQRIRRAIERERLKGTGRHWSYDLNRHIALKQALDRLLGTIAAPVSGLRSAPVPHGAANENGARRRRR